MRHLGLVLAWSHSCKVYWTNGSYRFLVVSCSLYYWSLISFIRCKDPHGKWKKESERYKFWEKKKDKKNEDSDLSGRNYLTCYTFIRHRVVVKLGVHQSRLQQSEEHRQPTKKKKKKFSTRDRKTTKKTYNYHKIYVPSQFSTSDDGYSFRVNKWCDFVFRGLDW